MDEEKRIKVKGIRRPIYYEYISLTKLDKKYHLINLDSEGYNLLIPEGYKLNYSQSINNYDGSGHINFNNLKSTYTIDYVKINYNDFKYNLQRFEKNIKKTFINYRNQEFVEIKRDNIDYIYMYYNGYEYKIYSNHKLSINEYFDMYLILFSISRNKIYEDINLLKSIYYLDVNSIISFYNDFDLLLVDMNDYSSQVDIEFDDIIIYADEEYLKYKETVHRIEFIKMNDSNDKLSVEQHDNVWNIIGIFDFLSLGKYRTGIVCEYNEITSSDELSENDKITLLETIVNQKQLEINCNEDTIKNEFYKYLFNYLKNNLTFDDWNNYHIREFINIDTLVDYNDLLSDELIYELFMTKITDIETFTSLINQKAIKESTRGEHISIYPNKCVLKLSALNYFFSSIEFTFNDNYCLNENLNVL